MVSCWMEGPKATGTIGVELILVGRRNGGTPALRAEFSGGRPCGMTNVEARGAYRAFWFSVCGLRADRAPGRGQPGHVSRAGGSSPGWRGEDRGVLPRGLVVIRLVSRGPTAKFHPIASTPSELSFRLRAGESWGTPRSYVRATAHQNGTVRTCATLVQYTLRLSSSMFCFLSWHSSTL